MNESTQVDDLLRPSAIYAEINSHPPLMREQAKAAYIGREVDWPATFTDASEQPGEKASLMFYFEERDVRAVTGVVSLSEYPQLRSLHSDERLRVRGTIRKIDQLFIELDISKLVFAQSTHVLAGSV